MGESHILDDELACAGAGSTLRHARESAGLDLAAIGELTKIPERHLQAIEDGRFAALPARAYAVGFARTYARAVGLDEQEVARMVREELDGAPVDQGTRLSSFEAGDPARIPSSRFAWLGAGLALLVLIAGLMFWRSYYSPAAELPPIVADAPPPRVAPAQSAAPANAAAGQVVFTATTPNLWVRLYEAGGAKLLEKSLAQGEQFSVPAAAKAPLLWTAHPEALAITVNGRSVPPLASTMQTLKDVPVDAHALLARASAPAPAGQAVAPALAQAAPLPRRVAARSATKHSAAPAAKASPAPAASAAPPAAPASPAPASGQ